MKSSPRPSLGDDPSFLNSLEDLDINPAAPSRSAPGAVLWIPQKETNGGGKTLTPETFYGLNEKPFELSADPRFFYHSTSHDQVAQQLLTAIRRREGVVILTGDVGTGKTTLCRAVVEQLDRRTLTSFVLDVGPGIEELLKAVLADFGVMSQEDLADGAAGRTTRRELNTALRQFLTSLTPLQAFAVIIIDSAQSLTVDVLQHLRMLSDIVSRDRLLQVVLVGKPGLLELVSRPELQQLAHRVSVRCTLDRLFEDETGDYLSHRLAVAGWTGPSLFDTEAQARLYELSAGNPRVINLISDRVLTLGCQAASAVIDRGLVDRAADELQISPPLLHHESAPDLGASGSTTLRSRFRSRLRGWLS